MKITLDTNTGDVKVGGKLFDELEDYKKNLPKHICVIFLRKIRS